MCFTGLHRCKDLSSHGCRAMLRGQRRPGTCVWDGLLPLLPWPAAQGGGLSACDMSDPAALPPGHPSRCPRWALQGFMDGVRHHAGNLAHTWGKGLLVKAMVRSSMAARPQCRCSGPRYQLWKGFRPHVCCPDAWRSLLDHRAQSTGCLWAWTHACVAERLL